MPNKVQVPRISDAIAATMTVDRLNPWHEVGLVIDGVDRIAYVKIEGGVPTEIQIFD
jgi:hypothetical protein